MFDIPSILTSLRRDVQSGRLSIREAAEELHCAGWTNFIDEETTAKLLHLI